MKVIKIKQCYKCPYCEWQWKDFEIKSEMVFSCTQDESNVKAIEDRFIIQDWCSLEDYKEGGKI